MAHGLTLPPAVRRLADLCPIRLDDLRYSDTEASRAWEAARAAGYRLRFTYPAGSTGDWDGRGRLVVAWSGGDDRRA